MALLDRFTVQISQTASLFKIMSWNMLADQLATNFPAVKDSYLEWNYRKVLLALEFERVQADIICVQELDHYEDFLKPYLEAKGYSGEFRKKPNWHNDGLAIFYLTSKFTKLESYFVNFPGNQFSIGLLLQAGESNFYVFNTHLKAKKEFDPKRVIQVNTLLAFIRDLPVFPIFLCGDFNSLPGTNAYNAMLSNDLGLTSIYRREAEPEFTTVKFRKELEIKTEDYIWQRGFQICDTWSLPTMQEIGDNGLPSENYPSDHLSLAASVHFL